MRNPGDEQRFQILVENNFNVGKLYRLKKDWILKLQVSSQLIAEHVRVFCNLSKNGQTFCRNTYYEYKWQQLSDSLMHDDFDKFIEIRCQVPGSYNYYFTLDNTDKKESSRGGSNFLVDPNLCLTTGEYVDLDCIQIQTYISKLLGPLDEWKSRLEVAKQTGYNMIHFTPVSELSSESGSAYCIRNHLDLLSHANRPNMTPNTFKDLATLTEFLYKEWNVFSICDLVYNHMANDADFLKECPEATYNMVNCPYLIPPFVLDRIFAHATLDVARGKYHSRGIINGKLEYSNIETLKHILRHEQIPKYNLEEFFVLDLEKIMEEVKRIGAVIEKDQCGKGLADVDKVKLWQKLVILQDEGFKRLGASVDFDLVAEIIQDELHFLNFDEICDKISCHLNEKNQQIKTQIQKYLTEAVDNVMSNFNYHFFAHDGPKWQEISVNQPIVATYFYFPFEAKSVEEDERLAVNLIEGCKIQAHNGWVMSDDPLQNFASRQSTTYFRRHLIPWCDSVKLRFGTKPSDNPKLWSYMEEYTKATAKIFHGVRLDNCHSTPIHVAQYFLDIARTIRPNLYVTAELFTNSMNVDNMFITELGITSLIRESLSAWDASELGRLMHRFGGDPVGSFFQQPHRPLRTGIACATFFDVTHDNEALIDKHCVLDALATSSLVVMCSSAVGSTRGFDELVPHHIDVVKETRLYSVWKEGATESNSIGTISFSTGLIKAKSILNKLHYKMAIQGFNQIYVDQFDSDTCVITRHSPQSHESFIMIARTAFKEPQHSPDSLHKPLEIPSRIESIVFEGALCHVNGIKDYEKNRDFVNGLENYRVELAEDLDVASSRFVQRVDYDGEKSYVHFRSFPPGAVMVFKVTLNEECVQSLAFIRESIFELSNASVDGRNKKIEIEQILGSLSFDELNILLFRCSNEEVGENIDSNTYTIPNHGSLVYCGLQGFMNILEKERLCNNLGHQMFENLRQGNWMLYYITTRLRKYSNLQPTHRIGLNHLADWLQTLFDSIANLPRYLIPAYFDLIITGLYTKALDRCFWLMSSLRLQNKALQEFDITNGSSFIKSLALGSVLFNGYLSTALLPNSVVESDGLMLSLSAGLPHFADSYMRNWGRDTFISVRGLLLLANRFKEARHLILSYASTMRHGLIPNLLGEGKMSRFNCRDAVWWWLKAIKEYTELAPDGFGLLKCQVIRLYPSDESEHPSDQELTDKKGVIVKLEELIQEALTVHIRGLKFRERNAGLRIDEHMLDEGFSNQIGVDLDTGFVFGGNKLNCGTWMDKLGSSQPAGNKGLPATPRDGSAIELVGLSRSVLDWLINAHAKSEYPYEGVLVETAGQRMYTWREWAERIDSNFEKHFWIGEQSQESVHINKRNIYKDTLGSSVPWTDYQLRPNFLIALTVAPQMVNKEHATKALEQAKLHLVDEPDSVGVKTLDASDMNYCGNYDNSDHSNDPKLAHGFNYHQGPEWLWPIGYFLRAELMYAQDKQGAQKIVKKHLGKLYERLLASEWKSLPELTNRNGESCYFSCDAQAWSVATTLEALFDLAAS